MTILPYQGNIVYLLELHREGSAIIGYPVFFISQSRSRPESLNKSGNPNSERNWLKNGEMLDPGLQPALSRQCQCKGLCVDKDEMRLVTICYDFYWLNSPPINDNFLYPISAKLSLKCANKNSASVYLVLQDYTTQHTILAKILPHMRNIRQLKVYITQEPWYALVEIFRIF